MTNPKCSSCGGGDFNSRRKHMVHCPTRSSSRSLWPISFKIPTNMLIYFTGGDRVMTLMLSHYTLSSIENVSVRCRTRHVWLSITVEITQPACFHYGWRQQKKSTSSRKSNKNILCCHKMQVVLNWVTTNSKAIIHRFHTHREARVLQPPPPPRHTHTTQTITLHPLAHVCTVSPFFKSVMPEALWSSLSSDIGRKS